LKHAAAPGMTRAAATARPKHFVKSCRGFIDGLCVCNPASEGLLDSTATRKPVDGRVLLNQ
jgi:hypothetical protein